MKYLESFEKLNSDSRIYKEITGANIRTIRDSLGIILLNYDMNADDLRSIPHNRFFDLAIVPVWRDKEEGAEKLVVLSDALCEQWEMSSEDLLEMATGYSPDSSGFMFLKMSDYLNVVGPESEEVVDMDMYILSNRNMNYGSSALCYFGVLEDIREELGTGFFVFPANVHHMIVVPDHYPKETQMLYNRSINEVNLFTLPISEFLSNGYYYYDADTKDIILVDESAFAL